jgi:hypothetical protein
MPKKTRTLKATRGSQVEDFSRPTLPSFTLTEKDLPEIKNWQVGNKYKLEIEVEQVSLEKNEYLPNQPITARFRIRKIKDMSNNPHNSNNKKAKKGYS